MADGPLSGFLRHLGAALEGDGALSDERLLERFLRHRDEPAFEALVRRHGPMVLGICRRILRDPHDAEDAFQATFLALVRKAATLATRELLGNWLYGVAYRTALYARRKASRRRAMEKQVEQIPERGAVESESVTDLRAFLDRELSRLPEVYRIPLVLCELEGKTRQEVARQLDVPEGTVSSRLARGRELLRKRLVRQGVALAGAAPAAALAEAAAPAAVPVALVRATVRAGVLIATGRAAAVSAPVAGLLRGVLRQRLVAKLKAAVLVLLVVALAAGLVVGQPWRRDPPGDALGNAPPPRLVEDHRRPSFVRVTDPEREGGLKERDLVNINGTLFFVAGGVGKNGQLWKCTPTANGVKTARLTNLPAEGSAPWHLTNVGGTLFFVVRDSKHGRRLWKSDGTRAGTVMVKDINPGGVVNPPPKPGAQACLGLMSAGKTLFFVCSNDIPDGMLWKSDGTAAGTTLVKRVGAWPAFSDRPWRRGWADVNGTLFFVGHDRVHGRELWKSDGTEEGTVLVKDINPGAYDSDPSYLTIVNGTLFFTADDGVHGRQLWKTDGTDAGTKMVKAINLGRVGAFPDATMGNLTAVGRTLFFTADDGVHGLELWKSDGTEKGTVLVKDINPGPASSMERRMPGETAPPGLGQVIPPGSNIQRFGLGTDTMAVVSRTLFFVADDGVHGYELWKSDGTAAGTVLVKDIAPGSQDANPNRLTHLNGTLYFVAGDGVHYRRLCKSDGTEAGTVPLMKFVPDSVKPRPLPFGEPIEKMVATSDGLFFAAHGVLDSPVGDRGLLHLWYMQGPRRRHD
jgi:RNA polymerase sigma factor (sigma-70 family)